jgi:hypothetical protein
MEKTGGGTLVNRITHLNYLTRTYIICERLIIYAE